MFLLYCICLLGNINKSCLYFLMGENEYYFKGLEKRYLSIFFPKVLNLHCEKYLCQGRFKHPAALNKNKQWLTEDGWNFSYVEN